MAKTPKANPLGEEVLALRREVRELRKRVEMPRVPAENPDEADDEGDDDAGLSPKAIEQLHEAHRKGMLDDDVLDEICPGGENCPDADDDAGEDE